MSTFLVLALDNETGAQEMIGHVQTLQRQQLLTVSDAATVVRQADGMVVVKQANSLVGAGAWGGAFWGLLIGLLFWSSWLGTESCGSVANKVSRIGLNDDFIKEVINTIGLEYSALFMIVAYMDENKVLQNFSGHQATILSTNLSLKDEAQLCKSFGVAELF